jgi:hypothetical protein
MNRLLQFTAVALVGFLVPEAHAGKKLHSETFLVRPELAPDPDAKGRLKLDLEVGKDRDKLEVKGANLDSLGSYSVEVEDAVDSGVFVVLGALSADDDDVGEFKLKLDEKKAPLPLGMASVAELYDREIRIVDGGAAVLLVGVVPDPADMPKKKGFKHEKSSLAIPLGGIDPDAKGRVEIWLKGKDLRQRFRVKAENLDAAGTFTVELEDGVALGTFTAVADMVLDDDGDPGEFKLHLDTQKGEAMPGGVAIVTELEGRMVRIVDGSANVLLEGIVPEL